ncbi:MAG: hypothetical protein HDT16_07830 [Oscillibacter sp.]|nr:hypothetical protein [Oscillibacter sp.]
MISTPHYIYETAVAYSDIGPNQRLSDQGLLRILQEAASVASDDVGYGLKDIPSTKVHWILTGWRLELKSRPYWRADLRVETWPRTLDGFASDRSFLVFAGEELIAQADSRWILVSAETGRPARVTDAVRAAYQSQLDGQELFAGRPIPHNGSTPAGSPVTFETVIGRRDIDTNYHVNNLHYLDYAIEALPEEIYKNLPATVEIVFRRQILLGTPIRCLYTLTEDGKHQVEIQSEKDGKVTHHAFVWFY